MWVHKTGRMVPINPYPRDCFVAFQYNSGEGPFTVEAHRVRRLCFLNEKFREGRKEGNVLFNDALNTFYLRLYGVRHMVKDHTYSERVNPLPPHGLLFSINNKGSFICTIPKTGLHIPQPLLHQSWSTGWNEK